MSRTDRENAGVGGNNLYPAVAARQGGVNPLDEPPRGGNKDPYLGVHLPKGGRMRTSDSPHGDERGRRRNPSPTISCRRGGKDALKSRLTIVRCRRFGGPPDKERKKSRRRLQAS